MKIIATHEGFAPGAHKGILESIEVWAQEHLEPLLSPFKGEPRLRATVKCHGNGAAMVEDEIFENHQPDEVLRLDDVLPDETAALPETGLEVAERMSSLGVFEPLTHALATRVNAVGI